MLQIWSTSQDLSNHPKSNLQANSMILTPTQALLKEPIWCEKSTLHLFLFIVNCNSKLIFLSFAGKTKELVLKGKKVFSRGPFVILKLFKGILVFL